MDRMWGRETLYTRYFDNEGHAAFYVVVYGFIVSVSLIYGYMSLLFGVRVFPPDEHCGYQLAVDVGPVIFGISWKRGDDAGGY